MERENDSHRDQDPETREDAGRLVEKGSGLRDHEKDEVAEAAQDDLEDRSAEEAAVRVEESPEGVTGGSDEYVEEDEDDGRTG